MDGWNAPGFLVAAPSMRCPFFNHTLVLIVEHNEDGAFGFVINKSTDLSMDEVLDEIGCPDRADSARGVPIMLGGPVSPESGWILYDARDVGVPETGRTIAVDNRIACSASLELLQRIAKGDGPTTCTMMLGYAGWGAGQLEGEMKQGSWIPVDLDYRLIFETPLDDRWRAALATLGIDPARVIDHEVARA